MRFLNLNMLLPLAGRITEIKKDTKGHSLSVACYMHKKCSRIRLMKDLPYGCIPMVVAYLEAGLRFPSREDTKKHTDMLLGLYTDHIILNIGCTFCSSDLPNCLRTSLFQLYQ